jgi:hypothetical protein
MEPKQLNVAISPELKKQLELYCIMNDKTRKDVVEKALRLFLNIEN